MQDTINKLTYELNKTHKINVQYKDDSLLMKIISFILFFNKGFSNDYITTIGNTVYIPKNIFDKYFDYQIADIICHEFIHIADHERMGIFFSILYLAPQCFGIFALLGLLGFVYQPLFYLFLFAVFLLPIPSPWRRDFELKAYKMTLFLAIRSAEQFKYEINKDNLISYITFNFSSYPYYFMWPWGVRKELEDFCNTLTEYENEEMCKIILNAKNIAFQSS